MNRTEKHEFALYYKPLSSDEIKVGKNLTISDRDMVHRVLSVLRLEINDTCVFFNDQIFSTCTLVAVQKKGFVCAITAVSKIVQLQPTITLMLPLLKREALEAAVYNATVMGVTTIQCVITEKSSHWSGGKELERLARVAISAAEQSKQFALPVLLPPMLLADFLKKPLQYSIVLHADVDGLAMSQIVDQLPTHKSFLLSVGPEGDLTKFERDMLLQARFTFVRLTQSVLKAEEALSLLVGIVRSFT